MRYRQFGATELTVSGIGLGGAQLGGYFPSVSAADMLRTVRSALREGITFFDSADMYWAGESERLLGQALRACRNEVVIATKAGYLYTSRPRIVTKVKPFVWPLLQQMGIKRAHPPTSVAGPPPQDFSPQYIVQAAERSLKRLRTDYLDLFQLHNPPTSTLEGGTFLAPLESLQRDGKIRYFGISCATTQDALICLRYPSISALQIRLNLLDQSALTEVITRARAQNVALIARECFATGLLTPPIVASKLEAIIPDPQEREEKGNLMLRYADMAGQSGRSLTEMALQFVHGIDGIAVMLVGMRTEAHVQDTVRMMSAPALSEQEYQSLRGEQTA